MIFQEVCERIERENAKRKLTFEDVLGDENNKGMIVASGGEICPIFHDEVPYKAYTVVCDKKDEADASYWLDYIHGGGISNIKYLDNNNVAIRSNYMCW